MHLEATTKTKCCVNRGLAMNNTLVKLIIDKSSCRSGAGDEFRPKRFTSFTGLRWYLVRRGNSPHVPIQNPFRKNIDGVSFNVSCFDEKFFQKEKGRAGSERMLWTLLALAKMVLRLLFVFGSLSSSFLLLHPLCRQQGFEIDRKCRKVFFFRPLSLSLILTLKAIKVVSATRR